MLPAGSLEAELIGIINKPLLLHLVGVYIIYINDARSNKYQVQGNSRFFFNSRNHIKSIHIIHR